jgi:hypothetical protein
MTPIIGTVRKKRRQTVEPPAAEAWMSVRKL